MAAYHLQGTENKKDTKGKCEGNNFQSQFSEYICFFNSCKYKVFQELIN